MKILIQETGIYVLQDLQLLSGISAFLRISATVCSSGLPRFLGLPIS